MKALWTNDIHLEFLDSHRRRRFLRQVGDTDADCVLIAGDIGQASSIMFYLFEMELTLKRPIYFVLGNHDAYYGSIRSIRSSVRDFVAQSRRLRWLTESGVVRLTDKTALIGHDGWADGRFGDYFSSSVQLNDFRVIAELTGLSLQERLQRIQALGDETAEHFRTILPEALAAADHVVVLTHVPPFAEAAWHEGKQSGPDWLPFFSCRAAGEVLKAAMEKHPEKKMTVLCGHTHGGGISQILPNLIVHTGVARYGHPVIQEVFNWD